MGELAENHYQQLIPAAKATDTPVAIVSVYQIFKPVMSQKLDQLREYIFALIHCPDKIGKTIHFKSSLLKNTRKQLINKASKSLL
jgi:hypothetical protein